MKYEAVIFDLFGTLIDSYPYEEYQNVLGQMASVLTVPFDDFRRLWYETAQEHSLGAMASIEDNIKYICNKLEVIVDNKKGDGGI